MLKLSPQAATIRNHLLAVGSISNVEAHTVHKCRSVSRRITEIARADPTLVITKERKIDATGQRYVRYNAKVRPIGTRVGDRVRITAVCGVNRRFFQVGEEGEVVGFYGIDGGIHVRFANGDAWVVGGIPMYADDKYEVISRAA